MNQNALKVGIQTLGCKVNQYESEAIAELFRQNGFSVHSSSEKCDIYVVNTCTVTAESDRKAGQIIRRLKHQNPDALILVTGCLSQTQPERIAKIEGVDYICGNAEKQSVVRVALDLLNTGKPARPILQTAPPDAFGFEKMSIRHFDRTRAYIKIEDGCESRCTYCIIPTARGTIRSKNPADVLDEVRRLTENGCREIVLTGIETASYGKDLGDCDLADLLCKIDSVPNIGRIRLGSLDPSLMKQEFVSKIAGLSSLAPHFHLSMQSGSDTVLAAMRRKYNTEMAFAGIERLREAIPDVQFTTDMIVGFPGETDDHFRETMEFAKSVGFLKMHVFPYSRRKGTVADTLPNQIPEEIKHRRAAELISLDCRIRERILDSFSGRTEEVLFETYENGFACGHTAHFLEVSVSSEVPLHTCILPVHITHHDSEKCFGTLEKEKR